MLAFLLSGFAALLGHREGRRGRLPAAAACFTLAAGTGYTALVPIAGLFLWALARRAGPGELAALAAAPAALGLWLAAMTAHFGYFPLAQTAAYYLAQPRADYAEAVAVFTFLGGVAVAPWSFAWAAEGAPRLRVAAAAAAAGVLL